MRRPSPTQQENPSPPHKESHVSHLFSPLELGPLELANRIVVAPMCQYSAEDGSATDWHMMHLGNLALSGAGLLIFEASAVEARGRITWADLGLYSDGNEQALRKVVGALRQHAPTALGIQLAHAGRKASTHVPWDGGAAIAPDDVRGWQVVSASDRPFHDGDPAPRAMTQTDIDDVAQAFADAARRADRLGLDLIEIHAAHGYLLHQFLSPLSNDRDDDFGGSLENRMRLTLQVFDAVRAAVSDRMSVGIRISASDWVEGGWDLAQSIELARALDARGCQFIHVSSGGLDPRQQIEVGPGYQVPFAAAIKAEVAMPVIAVGQITEAAQAEAIVAEGKADAVALARGMLYDPRWPWHAAAELGSTAHAPPQYLRCPPHGLSKLFG
ncbi:NADH:flavin oxidoreductase/NADH oxidase [Oleiagrimonas sp. MCCC 1A03011]|uniref:NADH:flavin oxidoreductase/NADH oxidase n=1 Tax=Oleiagrimonas sp. MCCC 1A03011 TaxID=1926883 RepID=UPI000DC46A9F|nr:NADH:flavin oxidoreductase/NADH oxidase [Oleiagrimonas sp. MCCC 1A03011]RAP59480.1 oxidoreductase [Oleiagrimonas sp. MCCC 1A03011]